MTIKEIALIVGLWVLAHFAIEGLECAIWWAFNRLDARRAARKKKTGK